MTYTRKYTYIIKNDMLFLTNTDYNHLTNRMEFIDAIMDINTNSKGITLKGRIFEGISHAVTFEQIDKSIDIPAL